MIPTFSEIIISSKRPDEALAFIRDKCKFDAVVFQKEVTKEECDVERECENFCLQNNVTFQAIWGSTLYHKDDLPYDVKRYAEYCGVVLLVKFGNVQ